METDWNALTEEYQNHDHAIADWRLGYLEVEKLLGDVMGKTILDYGCGTGKFSRHLSDAGATVIAIDKSDSALEIARRKDGKNIDYRLVTDNNLSFIKNESLDYCVITFVLCGLSSLSEIDEILKEIYKKLKKHGSLIICDPNPHSLGYEYISMMREKPENLKSGSRVRVQLSGLGKTFSDYWYSLEDYRKFLTAAGFILASVREPKIPSVEERFWKDERTQAPFIIFEARLNNLDNYINGTYRILHQSSSEKRPYFIRVADRDFVVYPGVFSPKYFKDSVFFAQSLPVEKGEELLEIGCGAGLTSVIAAIKGAKVTATDINPVALENTRENALMHQVSDKIMLVESDLYRSLGSKKFDSIFWNVPWMDSSARNLEERSVFDKNHHSLKEFIEDAHLHLKQNGKVFIGFSSTLGNLEKLKEFCNRVHFRLNSIASTSADYGDPIGLVDIELFQASA